MKGVLPRLGFFPIQFCALPVEMLSALPLLAEFLGTFLLVLAILASGTNPWIVGGALALIILLVGSMSGAHVNPAVSVAMFLKGALSTQELAAYMAVQVLGGAASLYAYNAFA
jgi:aquaporin Z